MREEEKNTSQKSKSQRILKKRWTLAAIYIASAAIILAAALWAQNSFNDSADNVNDNKQSAESGKNLNQPAMEVNSQLETIKMPVEKSTATVIKKEFYDKSADKDTRAAALVFYNNRYLQNKGIDIAAKGTEDFAVVASLSGSVTKVKEDSLLGNEIDIEHENGVVTRYQSVKDIKVAVGDKVKQGEKIATAGRSLINEEAGTHVHFEVRKDGIALNPLSIIGSQLSTIESTDISEEDSTGDSSKNIDKTTDTDMDNLEEAPADDSSKDSDSSDDSSETDEG